MLRPLFIGLPVILLIVAAFVIGMNTVPPGSQYFPYVIGGYAVLFPLALLATIIGTIRSVSRATNGGDATLQQRGRRAMATVTAVKPSSMTVRTSGSLPMRMIGVTLRVEDTGSTPYEIKATQAVQMWDAGVSAGARVPVFIDPVNPKKVFVSWAEASGVAMPADTTSVNVQSIVIDGRQADLSQVPAGLRQLLQAGLNQVQQKFNTIDGTQLPPEALAKLKALGIKLSAAHGDAGQMEPAQTTIGHGVVHQIEAAAQPVREEGRARIEALQPNPDGTYELDLFVTPKTRSSYRLTVALPVPPEHADKMRKGQYLAALLDPAAPETIEIDWERI